MKKSLLLLISIWSLGLLNACGGASGGHLTVATHLSIIASTTTPAAGTAFNFTVTALNASNEVVTSYPGTVHFTSSDGKAILPPNSTLTNGTGIFPAKLKTAASETITATDTVTGSITGTSSSINVAAVGAAHLSVTASATATAGTAISFTVTALDAFDNVVSSYSGAVHFMSTDSQAALPENSTLANGTTKFLATLKSVGSQTITAADTVTVSIAGTSNLINVSAPESLTIASGAPPDGAVGVTYGGSHSLTIDHVTFSFSGWPLTATGGVSDYHWTWAAAQGSSVPPGLSVTVLTLFSGGSTRCCVTAYIPVIGGTPITAGTYHVIVTVTDSGSPVAHVSVPYTITISNSPSATASARPWEQHTRYRLIDLGTLGGPNSNSALPFFDGVAVPSLSQPGSFAGQAESPTPDPFSPNCLNFDCYVSHAIKSQDGILTDLGALPGPAGLSSVTTWISGNGLIAGFSENGEVDPFTGIQSVHGVVWNHARLQDLGTLKGGYESVANAVNNQGQIVGYANNAILDPNSLAGFGSQTRAVAWWNGKIQDLGTLGGADAVALYVNERGLIVGESYTSSSVPPPILHCGDTPLSLHAFIWENGQMSDLKTLGGTCAFAYSLNKRGQVVGQANLTGDHESHPFLWEHGVMKDLGALGGTYGYAGWVSDEEQVVGAATDKNDQRLLAFLWKAGAMNNLGTLDGNSCSAALAINSKGQVVGGSGFYDAPFFPACTDAVEHAVLWEDGKAFDLNALATPPTGLTLSEATFINDRGDISGFGTLPNGDQHAFILVPCGRDESAACGDADQVPNAIQSAPSHTTSPATIASKPDLKARAVDGGLHPRLAYSYRSPLLRAPTTALNDGAELDALNAVLAITNIEQAPTNLTSFAFKRGLYDVVELGWTDHSTDADSYHVERCTGLTCTNFSEIAVTGGSATGYINSMWPMHLTFRYRVRAHGPGGYSGYSNIRTQTTP
jgi:probable HAF family extracellular repeat protein